MKIWNQYKNVQKKNKKINFEDELLKSLRNNIEDDPDKQFLMSLLPQMKSVSDEKKPMLYIELIKAIQKVKNLPLNNLAHHGQSLHSQNNSTYLQPGGYSQPFAGPSMFSNPQPVIQPAYLESSYSDGSTYTQM